MACLFGHQWNGCTCKKCGKYRDENHDWNGCTCRICGKKRAEGHDWQQSESNKCHETCSICGAGRYVAHVWKGCTCTRCDTVRDEMHDFQPVSKKCEEKCTICGKIRTTEHQFVEKKGAQCVLICSICGHKTYQHRFERFTGVCSICNKAMDDEEFVHALSNDLIFILEDHHTGRPLQKSDEEYVRSFGVALNERGGMKMMRAVGTNVSRSLPMASRYLEYLWDGIGSWQA